MNLPEACIRNDLISSLADRDNGTMYRAASCSDTFSR